MVGSGPLGRQPNVRMWMVLGMTWAGECEQTTLEDVHLRLEAAEGAFAARDRDGVLEHTQAAVDLLPCIEEPLTASDAARYHRVQGLRHYLAADEEGASAYFAAARFAQPDYKLPSSLVPMGHPAQQLYAGADSFAVATEAVAAPVGSVTFDGRTTLERPATRPTIVQILNAGGAVLLTDVLEPGEPMPGYEAVSSPDPEPEPAPAPESVVKSVPEPEPSLGEEVATAEPPVVTKAGHPGRRGSLIASGVGLAASGGMFLASGYAYNRYYECEQGTVCQTNWETLNHRLFIAGAAVGSVALTTGVVGIAFTAEF